MDRFAGIDGAAGEVRSNKEEGAGGRRASEGPVYSISTTRGKEEARAR